MITYLFVLVVVAPVVGHIDVAVDVDVDVDVDGWTNGVVDWVVRPSSRDSMVVVVYGWNGIGWFEAFVVV